MIIAIGFAVLAAILTALVLKNYTSMNEVLVVTRDILPYEEITAESVALIEMPKTAIPDDVITDSADAVGSYPKVGLLNGTVLRSGHFTSKSLGGNLSYELTSTEESYMRALALPNNTNINFGNMLGVNDRIDIVVTGTENKEPFTKILIRNVRVIDITESVVVLAVTPRQAEAIIYAMQAGSIFGLLTPYDADPEDAITESIYTQGTFINDCLNPEAIAIQERAETDDQGDGADIADNNETDNSDIGVIDRYLE